MDGKNPDFTYVVPTGTLDVTYLNVPVELILKYEPTWWKNYDRDLSGLVLLLGIITEGGKIPCIVVRDKGKMVPIYLHK